MGVFEVPGASDFGRKTYIFSLMEAQVSGIQTNEEAIFFLTKRGGFKDLDTGIRTTRWKLILPVEWKARVKEELK